jgi:aspartyl-tRNA(Asn)/glutamyl-tRNA(Gln) amidotransferase subunit B
VFATMLDTGETAEAIVDEQGLAQIRDSAALEAWVDQVIAGSPTRWPAFVAGRRS